MPTGKRTPDEIKKQVARRFHKGESSEALAQEFGVSVFSVREWGKMFPDNPRKAKRRVIPKQPTENTRVLELEKRIKELEGKVEFWREAYNSTVANSK